MGEELRITRYGRGFDAVFRIDADEKFVCSVQGDNLEPAKLSIREAERYAELFAAAPAMWDALRLARDALGANAARDAVDAAIAKAEGRV